uniref:EF-hand domain-containing protein n=1 Tax=Macrostomum lignano TaxID=282301 RepID=A0A1I8HHI5_9PLAT
TNVQYEELFDKIDISKEGSVSWDQLAQHMLLQFYERDDKVKSTQLPQWRDIRMIPAPHKDVIQRVDFLRSSHKYVTVSREGTISLMSTDLEVSRTPPQEANNHVCLWNPYVMSKPSGVLTGHVAPVIQVLFNLTRSQMKAEVKDRVLSHDRSVTSVIFSWQLNQLLTACQGSNLSFWLIDTGQRLRQTPNAHGDAEITTLANDPAESRFYSGGTDGIVRIWDWNGHMYTSSTVIVQILVLKHSLIACGFSKDITVFRTNSFRDIRIKPGEWRELDQHRDDILAAAYCAPHYLITASYDGMIAVWNISSEVCTRKMRQRCSTMRRQASSSAGSGERRRSARSDRQQQQ